MMMIVLLIDYTVLTIAIILIIFLICLISKTIKITRSFGIQKITVTVLCYNHCA